MQNKIKKQKQMAKAVICIKMAMKAYAKTGEEDFFLVGGLLSDCMHIISDKMVLSNK